MSHTVSEGGPGGPVAPLPLDDDAAPIVTQSTGTSLDTPRSQHQGQSLQDLCQGVKGRAQAVLTQLGALAQPSSPLKPVPRFTHLTLDVPDQTRTASTPFSTQSPRRPVSTSRVSSPRPAEAALPREWTDAASPGNQKAYLIRERVSELLGVFTAPSPSSRPTIATQGEGLSHTKSSHERSDQPTRTSAAHSRPCSAQLPSPRTLLSHTSTTLQAAHSSTALSNRPSSDYAESNADTHTYLSERDSKDSCLQTPITTGPGRPAAYPLFGQHHWPGQGVESLDQPASQSKLTPSSEPVITFGQPGSTRSKPGNAGALLKSPGVAPWDAHTDTGAIDDLQEYVHSMDGTPRKKLDASTLESASAVPERPASTSPSRQETVVVNTPPGPVLRQSNPGLGIKRAQQGSELSPQPPRQSTPNPTQIVHEVKRPASQQGRLARVWHRTPDTRPATAATLQPVQQAVDASSLGLPSSASQPRPHTAAECITRCQSRPESPGILQVSTYLRPSEDDKCELRTVSAGGARPVRSVSSGGRPATTGVTSRSPLCEASVRPGSSAGGTTSGAGGEAGPPQPCAHRRTASPMLQRGVSQGNQQRKVSVITPMLEDPPMLNRPALYDQILPYGLEQERAPPFIPPTRVIKAKPALCSVSPHAWSINRSASAPHKRPEKGVPLLFGRTRQTDGGRWVRGLPPQLYMVDNRVMPAVPDSLMVSQITVFAPRHVDKALLQENT